MSDPILPTGRGPIHAPTILAMAIAALLIGTALAALFTAAGMAFAEVAAS